MDGFNAIILLVVITAILGIILVATLNMPIAFAGAISALGVGTVTAIVRFWPKKED